MNLTRLFPAFFQTSRYRIKKNCCWQNNVFVQNYGKHFYGLQCRLLFAVWDPIAFWISSDGSKDLGTRPRTWASRLRPRTWASRLRPRTWPSRPRTWALRPRPRTCPSRPRTCPSRPRFDLKPGVAQATPIIFEDLFLYLKITISFYFKVLFCFKYYFARMF